MTRPVIKPVSPGPLAHTLTAMYIYIYIYIYADEFEKTERF